MSCGRHSEKAVWCMSALPDRVVESARWLEYAAEDLATAQMIRAQGGPPRQVCTLAQQSVEKALKTGLVFDDIDPPRTHNLAQLRDMLAEVWSVKALDVALGGLSEWAIASRYPGDWEDPTVEEMDDALEVASAVLAAMRWDHSRRG